MSLRSMTGFGRAAGPLPGGAEAEISARSVNHRFLDLLVKAREGETALEAAVRKPFTRELSRGKVEVSLRLRRPAAARGAAVTLDEGLLAALAGSLREAGQRHGLGGTLELRDLLAVPGLFSVDNGGTEWSAEDVSAIEEIATRAAQSLVSMREVEGRGLAQELADRIALLQRLAANLASRRDEIVSAVHATLKERLAALFPEISFDAGRLAQEAALAADRADVAEELARLQGHLSQFGELVANPQGPVGKKLEFLSQEILRELNTLGSKARDLALVREVLEMKSETERLREQVQNVE
jgi:uncharacterized protein (TIGR00255 family)